MNVPQATRELETKISLLRGELDDLEEQLNELRCTSEFKEVRCELIPGHEGRHHFEIEYSEINGKRIPHWSVTEWGEEKR